MGGTTYFIAVDGFNADTGAIELNINASTVYVPYDFPTIQEAINASQDGDTVLVAPGTYDENIDFLDKSLSVLGAEGAEVTIVDGGGRNIPVARVIRTNPPAAVLHGFTIQNGTDTGVELFGFAVLEDSIVQDNSGCPAGVRVLGGSLPIIQRNVIQRNSCAGGAGGGIRAGGTTELQIIDNLITENTARDGGGIHFNAAGVVTIRGNTISHNVASQEGGGLSFANNTNPSIVQNLIVGNSTSSGSAIDWLVPSAVVGNPSLVNNTIADNVISSSSTPKAQVLINGFNEDVIFTNNIIVGRDGEEAVHCGDFTTESPSFAFNNVGVFGTVNYTSLVANGSIYSTQGSAIPNPPPGRFLQIGNGHAHPGHSGSDSPEAQGSSRYVIAAYTVSSAGSYSLVNTLLRRTDTGGAGFADGVDFFVRVNDNPVLLSGFAGNTPGAEFDPTSFDLLLGDLVVGDTIYVAVGPNESHVFDSVAFDFSISVSGTIVADLKDDFRTGTPRRAGATCGMLPDRSQR